MAQPPVHPEHSAVSAPELGTAVAKVKARVLPLFVVMFILNYIDRVNIGFVKNHLRADLHIDLAAYGFGAGLFFIGYALFEVPSNLLLQRVGARAWLARITLTWGIAATLMAFIQSRPQFYTLRFLLGVAEAGFFPGVIYYFTLWLPKAERGKATAIFLSGSAIASILSGPVSGALLQLRGFGLKGWQWMFLVEGLASVLLCGVVWTQLRSRPEDAPWLSDTEKRALREAIAAEQPAGNPQIPLLTLLRDPRLLLFCLIYFAIQLTIYAATFWLPSIIQKIGGLNDFQVGCLNSIPWILSIAAMYGFAAAASRWRHQQAWVALALLIAATGMFLSTLGSPTFAFVSVCFAALGFKAASSLFWPIPQNSLPPQIAAPALALINSLGNLGGFVAPATFGFLEKHTGSIQGGLYGLSIASILAALLVFRTSRDAAR
jgi:sugar phosphate permease